MFNERLGNIIIWYTPLIAISSFMLAIQFGANKDFALGVMIVYFVAYLIYGVIHLVLLSHEIAFIEGRIAEHRSILRAMKHDRNRE